MTAESKWLEPELISVPEDLKAAAGGHPLIAETLFRRGLQSPQAALGFLDPSHYRPSSPEELPDFQPGAELIAQAVENSTDICVWGDFDVDGQTSTTLLVEALRDLGAPVCYYIPDRERESHGFHPASLRTLLEQGVGLVITCDTGVSGFEAVRVADEFGAKVIITDHHDLPAHLPGAASVINPKRLALGHPLRELPGVGVAYLFAQGCYAQLGRQFPESRFIELAAMGIVADLAIQSGDVRYLLQVGLNALRSTSRPALLSLCAAAGIEPDQIDEEQITFGLAPRLNSLGRMEDANLGVEFLSSPDRERTDQIAIHLDHLNTQRKFLTDQVFQAAVNQVEKSAGSSDPVLILTGQGWPRGVLGIVASRLVEAYGKPAIVLSRDPEGTLGGSARSIPGVDISATISSAEEMLERHGGHPMAAGLLMRADNFDRFERQIRRFIEQNFGDVQPPALRLDGYLPLSDLNLSLTRDFARLAPFGPGNPGLVFASRAHEILETKAFGTANEHLRLAVLDREGNKNELIRWRGAGFLIPQGQLDIAFSARVNHFRGQDRLQLEWVDSRPHEAPEPTLAGQIQTLELVDWRWDINPDQRLAELEPAAQLEIWREGRRDSVIDGKTRSALSASPRLVVWTAPPDRRTLLQVVDMVSPRMLIFVGRDPGTDDFKSFVRQLAGMVKYVLRSKGGVFHVAAAAEGLSSLTSTVRAGIGYLSARGLVEVDRTSAEVLYLHDGAGEAAELAGPAGELRTLLLEQAAFRAYVRKCDLYKLIVG